MHYLLIFFLILVSTSTLATRSESQFITSSGAIYTRAEDDKGVFWVSPNGLSWSVYQGIFTNDGIAGDKLPADQIGRFGMDREVLHSPATSACENIGAKLPLFFSLNLLIKDLSPEDFHQMLGVPTQTQKFWSAQSINPKGESTILARPFYLKDPFGDLEHSSTAYGVICIR